MAEEFGGVAKAAPARTNAALADRLKMEAALKPHLRTPLAGGLAGQAATSFGGGTAFQATRAGGPAKGNPARPGVGAVGPRGGPASAGVSGAAARGGAIQKAFQHHDVSGVAAHTGGSAAQAAPNLGAAAHAMGNHVAFGTGTFNPGNHAGQALLAHELTHVVQQGRAAGGRPGFAGGAQQERATGGRDGAVR